MYLIKKEFAFSASHQLACLPAEHPCSRLHGHNYVVTVELKSNSLNEAGFVKDYRALDPIKKWIDETLDHKHLNDVFDFNPTAENMACHIFQIFKLIYPVLYSISISETPKTSATYIHEIDKDWMP